MLFRCLRTFSMLLVFAACCSLLGCEGSQSYVPSGSGIALQLGTSSLIATPDGTLSPLSVTVVRSGTNTNSISLTASGAPSGVTVTAVQPLYGNYGSLNFASSSAATPGLYPVTITASDGSLTATASVSLSVTAADLITITPASNAVLVRQDATPVSTAVSFTRTFGNVKAITVSAAGLPSGLTATFTQPAAGTTGTVTFATATTPAAAGTYSITLTATDGTVSATSIVTVTIAVVATVSNTTDTTLGVSGYLKQFMSTGFQPSIYNNAFFTSFPSTSDLVALNSEHLRLQTVHATIPWLANSSPQLSTDWSFTSEQQTVQPVLATGDNSPIYQLAAAPVFLSDANGHFVFTTANLQLLTTYAQNLVRYYNTGGFDWGGKHFQSTSSHPITWWAIYNEPNLNNITAAQYVQIYNTLVPAMLSVDPTLKFIALELSDYSGQPAAYLPQLVLPAASGGVSAQMNAISTHFYGTCNQTTTDTTVFSNVAQFATDITYFRTELQKRSDFANVPIWVTENNVNSDYQSTTGYSNCNPAQLFVSDPRGSSGFFTAWRPFVFSRLGKAGNQALYHFLYEGSNQYGEVSSTNAAKTLAYWTDYWLQRVFPWDGISVGSQLLKYTSTESTPSVEILVALNADNSVSLLVTNHAVAAAADDNGTGAPRTVLVDISALGAFTSASQITLNSATSTTTGPTATTVTPTTVLPVTFTGYGSTFFVLKR